MDEGSVFIWIAERRRTKDQGDNRDETGQPHPPDKLECCGWRVIGRAGDECEKHGESAESAESEHAAAREEQTTLHFYEGQNGVKHAYHRRLTR